MFQSSSPLGNNVIATRKAPYAPSFITTPASSIEAPVGAATWPVGAQVWKGHKPARIANPTNTSGNAHICMEIGYGYCASSTRFVVFAPAATYAARIPARTMALPKKEYNASFIAPYSRRVEPQMAIRKYLGMMANS